MEKGMPEGQNEIAVLLSIPNVGKVESDAGFDGAHENTVKWRKALIFGFYDARCAELLPSPGTVFLLGSLDVNRVDDYFLVFARNALRLIDTDGVETRRINGHRTDAAESHLMLGSARLRPALFDPDMVARWLSACTKSHRRKCDKHERQIKHPIRLLNTSTLHLRTFDPGSVPRYFTSSYVWGTEKYVRLEESNLWEATNLGFSHDANFHPSISDTIVLMKRVKETYLWVNSLCILQDRNTDKLAQIYQMDSIYANSTLTIVAAGDNQGGLPGILKPRPKINTVQAGPLTIVGDARASSESHWSDNTAWSSRAWTLQEYIISHRRVIFTADQVYWCCQGSFWRESIYLASFIHHYESILPDFEKPLTDRHTMSIKGFATKSRPRYVSRVSEVVEQYSGRNLTVQTDILSAFQGILNAIIALDPQKDHFWALTTWDFEFELDWSDANNYASKGEFVPIADGMFPSWSWLCYPASVAIGYNDPKVVCFRFLCNPVTGLLDCKRVSPMKYEAMPSTPDIN
jgi:hypothetical protein